MVADNFLRPNPLFGSALSRLLMSGFRTTEERYRHKLRSYKSNVDSGNKLSVDITQLGSIASAIRTTPATTLTATHTLLSGSNRISWCAVGTENANSIASATFGGVAATALTEKVYPAGAVRVRLFYVLNASLPADGARDWVVTFSGNVTYAAMACGTIQDAYQGAPEATANGNNTVSPVTDSITTLTEKAWIISVTNCLSTAVFTTYGAGQTERYSAKTANNQSCVAVTYEEKAIAGADTQSFTNAGTANNFVCYSAAWKRA